MQTPCLWWRRRFRLRAAFFLSFSRSGLRSEPRACASGFAVAPGIAVTALIAGIGRNGRGLGSLLLGHEFLALGAQRHVFAGFLGRSEEHTSELQSLRH